MRRKDSRRQTPVQRLRDRIWLADRYYANDAPEPIRGSGYKFELIYHPGGLWERRLLHLRGRYLGVTSFILFGLVSEAGADGASASLTYYGQEYETKHGVSLGRQPSIEVASEILGSFMLGDLDRAPGEVARNLRQQIASSTSVSTGLLEFTTNPVKLSNNQI